MSIQILAPNVVDQIAAGEVLDRPANLVKELVENSLDAGADQIDIEFGDGGRSVCVSDNGSGMSRADLELAVLRHATSKIVRSEDLYKLSSFGFRGEALASVAAVSRVILTSRLKGEKIAYRLQSEFGQLSEAAPISASEGTEIRVEELFANIPARLKFLKSPAAENGQIKTTLKALALANEAVGFSVRSKGELLMHWPKGQTFKERALSVLETDDLYYGSYELEGLRAEVLVSSPQETANVNRHMWFFVQRRWIQDRSLTAAVMEAYRNLLMHGEYPTVIARLTSPTEAVDVNVHPTKSQVKFADPQLAFRVTCRAAREILEKSPWLKPSDSPMEQSGFVFQPQDHELQPELPLSPAPAPVNLQFESREFERTQYNTKAFSVPSVRDNVQTYRPNEEKAFQWSDLQVLGQLNNTYILAQTRDSFYMVDQHAAHERVVFERLMESFKAGNIEVQNLLLPLVFDFSAHEVEALLKHKDNVEKLGLSVERMGPESLAVQAIPSIIGESAVSEALHKLAFELVENQGELAWEKSVSEIFASMACHSVIRAGQTMSHEEMKSLLVQMDQYPLSSFCPHGRPVFVKRKFSDIEREFGRIV